jgi:hypothetical protein
VKGRSTSGTGITGYSVTGTGIYGETNNNLNYGIFGKNMATSAQGLLGAGTTGVVGYAGSTPGSYAGYFYGNVNVTGFLSKGGGSFKIDHPLDPRNRFLYHSFVESPDMKNIYDGVITTDERGYAVVHLPEWFEALNKDYRYQLTIIDEADSSDFVQAKVVKGIQGNSFTLRTSAPVVTVSWQVTGIRKDAWAEANRIQVEVEKPAAEKGTCIYPEACRQ